LLNIPLKASFRYVHEPLSADEDVLPPLGNQELVTELQSRILHSRGGAFLITGFRGVGKSTLVRKALDQIDAESPPSDQILPVWLSVARSTTTERLLFAIVRRVFETLSDSGALHRLPPTTRHALIVAYMRTSLSFKETQSEAHERSAGVDMGAGSGKGIRSVAEFVVPKISMSAKRSHSMATEASFLAYSETDAEHDLMRIVALVDQLTSIAELRPSLLQRLKLRRGQERPRLHLVIVLDEVDKLTVDEAGLGAIEDLLSGIKNVLTASGAHFLVVAGPDLHDRAVRDAARGNGVYESVFGWRMYVPCIWDAADLLAEDMFSGNSPIPGRDPLVQYLRFKARGVPRRLLQEFNDFVVWEGSRPRLLVSDQDLDRVAFYAELETIMRQYFEKNGDKRLFPVPIDEDRWRLGGYYVVDWVLQSEGEPFTAAELWSEGTDADFDPLLRISRRNVERLLDHLAEREILEVVRENRPSMTVIADVAESRDKVYRLAEAVRASLLGFAARNESERGVVEVSLVGPVTNWGPAASASAPDSAPVAPSPDPAAKVLGKRYELLTLLGQGGMGSVYAGLDQLTGRSVAVKVPLAAMNSNPQALARLRREADIAMRLQHPQIVQTYDVVAIPDNASALVMELLAGPTLQQLIADDGPMRPSEVAAVGHMLAGALDYLARERVVRVDLKPANIIMQDSRGPVIVDLGIARALEASIALTDTGALVGTPMYMAPEQLKGLHPDPRSDLFALGVVLYYCLAGRTPWEHIDNIAEIMYSVINSQVDVSSLPVSDEFRQVLARMLALQPDDRFPAAAGVQEALKAVPEWRSDDGSRGFSAHYLSKTVVGPGSGPRLPSIDRRPTSRTPLPARALRIGRVPDNDLVLPDLDVSRHHAELRKSPNGTYEIVDLGSHHGTYVNGRRVSSAVIGEADIISIGSSTFRLAGGELRQFVDEGEVSFSAEDLVVKVGGGKVLLNHVTFPVPEKCLLGVIGPSGAGKSTLLGALTGMRPADTGTVLYDNRDLYKNYTELRYRIGLVPQESVLHTQLTARRALQYSAELRFPADTKANERDGRVDEVMGELGLTKHANTRADRLSGGQLKRVNVAQELLTKPSLLFLDEPTSGLDPGLDKSVMEQMRDLAHDGRTVIVVTASVANLDTCDRLLVLVPGGRVAYYGPPEEGLKYFGLTRWAEVFQAFERYPDRDWAAEYAASPAHAQYVLSQRPKPPAQANDLELPAAPPPQRRGALRQTSTLTRRYMRVIAADRGYMLLIGLLPVILGVLIHLVGSSQGLARSLHNNPNASTTLLVLVVCACFVGAASSVRELVKERTIYIRERAAGLSAGAYLSSKLAVLGGVVVVQSAVLVLVGLAGRPLPPSGAFLAGAPLVELLLGVAVLALASMCLGLLVSAVVYTSERAMPLLVLLTIIQVILSGGVVSLAGQAGFSELAWLSPSRWGFGAVASTANLNLLNPPTAVTDPLWQHTSANWLRDMGMMIGLALIFTLLTWIRLRRIGPRRRW